MKVMLVVDYYPPFNPGGSEWSVYELAKSFKERGVESIIVTPNYGAKKEEIIDGIKVLRIPSFKKTPALRSVINPIWQNNPLFFLWSGFWIFKTAWQQKVDLIHVHGKFMIPGSFLAARLKGIPFIVSIRDKQLLCSYGKCFFEKERYKACNFWEYIQKDMIWFFYNYIGQKNLTTFLYTLISAIWTRLANSIITIFAKRANKIVAISNSQKKYLGENGFKKVSVIYNSQEFKIRKEKARKNILFAGKISLGKGAFELLRAIALVGDKTNKYFFAGGFENFEKIDKIIKDYGIKRSVRLLGGVDHHKLGNLYGQVKIVVMPSIFPEAFGRVALEALAAGTPVVVSDRGGLPEIIEHKITGYICDVSPANLSLAIKEVLKNHQRYINNIKKRNSVLKQKFEINPINQHIKLYQTLLI